MVVLRLDFIFKASDFPRASTLQIKVGELRGYLMFGGQVQTTAVSRN